VTQPFPSSPTGASGPSSLALPDDYQPRQPQDTVLYQVLDQHLATFVEEAAQRGDGQGLPRFVERELGRFLECGVLAHGFARVRCGDCHFERLVPFSCKGRGFCPTCGGRRMVERAAHVVDEVLPVVPIRQWVLSLPHQLRFLVAWDHDLCRAVLRVYVRALLGFQRRRAKRAGIADGRSGAVTIIQRFGSGLRLNVHFHTDVLDGVFYRQPAGELAFFPLPPPTQVEVARLLATIHKRVVRLLRRRGLCPEPSAGASDDPSSNGEPGLAGLLQAAVFNLRSTGAHAGAPVLQIGRDPKAPWVTSRGQLQAHLDGFDLHAGVAIAADDREGLERLCRYELRPAVAQERLTLRDDGRVLVELPRPWHDGTTALLFEPLELLARLASFIPRPRTNLLLYHGVLAPNAKWRPEVVAYGRPGKAETEPAVARAAPPPALHDHLSDTPTLASSPRRRQQWAELMTRAFGVDVLTCPRCGGRMKLIATITDPAVIRAILDHLRLPSVPPRPHPARPPPSDPAACPDELWH